MRVFLTGATGYVGSVVAEKLQGKGHKVLGLARGEAADAKLRTRGVEPLRGDLKDIESLKRGANETDALLETEARGVSTEAARKQFGALYGFFSINNQLSAERAGRELGWKPASSRSIADDIENGSYRALK